MRVFLLTICLVLVQCNFGLSLSFDHLKHFNDGRIQPDVRRRKLLHQPIAYASLMVPIARPYPCQASEPQVPNSNVFEVQDPDTYSAVVYVPPKYQSKSQSTDKESLPLIVLLHGAGMNQNSALYEFTHSGSSSSAPGDHTQLPLFLLSNNQAPASLADNFVVVAPYVGKGKIGSLYNEPRTSIIAFVKWFRRYMEDQNSISINPQKVTLFGFSEGATLAVELATTRMFNALVLASYGFTGTLPRLAVERLQGLPIWVFHSEGDDIYNIECSKRLVESVMSYQSGLDVFGVGGTIKFTKLKPNESAGKGREHVRSALIASRSEEIYTWLLRQ
jgi:predicted peptidase